MLIGSSAQAGAFTEEIIREMASNVERPIVMALSNPTALAEAIPADLLEWTSGKALIATGSPFGSVQRGGVTHTIAQANNALVFPGLGLGVSVAKAAKVSDAMMVAAANAIAKMSHEQRAPGASLLPGVDQLRIVSAEVAVAVVRAAQEEGLARAEIKDPVQAVFEQMWRPEYGKIVL